MTNIGKIRIKSFNELFVEPETKTLGEGISDRNKNPDSDVFTTSNNETPSKRKSPKKPTKVKSRKKKETLLKNQPKISDFFETKTSEKKSIGKACQFNFNLEISSIRFSLPRNCKSNVKSKNIQKEKIQMSKKASKGKALRQRNEQNKNIESRLSTDIVIDLCSDSDNETKKENRCETISPSVTSIDQIAPTKRKKRPCPPYKKISGTNFAVDAFQFGDIEGVSIYFLTHFHADHYIGLTKNFQKPIYLSGITARLVRKFIGTNEKFLRELEINQPQIIEDVEVTALDANHCPGAIMLNFKLKTGKCILHTGDFRANSDMESEPVFWNNYIDTIYLDTTYISDKYAFQSQWESVLLAEEVIKKFQKNHDNQRILYVCGSYLIGKERFWVEVAKKFNLSVWAEEKRRNALEAIDNEEILKLLCKNPKTSNMHVIPIVKLNYQDLCTYFDGFKENFDTLLALRPSGWEKNSRPQYRGYINIVGIDYSEHSSYNELRRFVRYLKPNEVISTVPVERDLMITHKIPRNWYKYDKLNAERNHQPTITTYLKKKRHIKDTNDLDENINSSPLQRSEIASSDWMS